MPDPQPTELYELLGDTIPRLLHAGDEWSGQPYVYMDEVMVELGAGETSRHDKGIAVSAKFGTQITGPMSFSEMPQNIGFGGGYWRMNPLLLSCMGSSAAMPIPFLVYSTPKLLASVSDMEDIGSLVGA